MGTEPDLEYKIWRLTGFGTESGFLVSDPDPESKSIFLTLSISARHLSEKCDHNDKVFVLKNWVRLIVPFGQH